MSRKELVDKARETVSRRPTARPSGPRAVVVPLRRPAPGPYDAAFAGALRDVLALYRAAIAGSTAARDWAKAVAAAPPAHRRLLVLNRPATWWAALRLADLAEQRVRSAPADAVDLAEVAEVALARLPPGAVPPAQAADLAGRLWRLRALAWILRRDLGKARAALRRARRKLCRGTREPLERALLLEARGALLTAEGRGRRAARVLAAAAALFHQLGERLLERRVRSALARMPAA